MILATVGKSFAVAAGGVGFDSCNGWQIIRRGRGTPRGAVDFISCGGAGGAGIAVPASTAAIAGHSAGRGNAVADIPVPDFQFLVRAIVNVRRPLEPVPVIEVFLIDGAPAGAGRAGRERHR